MASIKSQRFNAPAQMHVDGRAIFIDDRVVLSANPVATDTLDFKIPAGLRVSQVDIQCDDLDSHATVPTIVFGVGFAPVNAGSSLPAHATYFAPAGQTTAQTGGRLRCNFKPITFEEDVFLRLTVGTAAATFQAGEVHAIVAGNCVGPR